MLSQLTGLVNLRNSRGTNWRRIADLALLTLCSRLHVALHGRPDTRSRSLAAPPGPDCRALLIFGGPGGPITLTARLQSVKLSKDFVKRNPAPLTNPVNYWNSGGTNRRRINDLAKLAIRSPQHLDAALEQPTTCRIALLEHPLKPAHAVNLCSAHRYRPGRSPGRFGRVRILLNIANTSLNQSDRFERSC